MNPYDCFLFSGKNCGSAGEVSHGQIDYPQDTLFGDTAVIICDQGLVINQ